MSLHPRPIDPIPEATARIARQAFPNGNRYILLRDELGTIYSDAEFAPLFSVHGQSALSPWRLALICVMQFLEDLTERQAADAVIAAEKKWSVRTNCPTYGDRSDWGKGSVAAMKRHPIAKILEKLFVNKH